jgi:hypothetical protein
VIKRKHIIIGILLLLFSIMSGSVFFAFTTFAFTIGDQTYVMASRAIGGTADQCWLNKQAGLLSVTGRPKNVPNPFKSKQGEGTTIIYDLSSDTGTKLIIYSITGSVVWQKSFDPGSAGGKAGQNNVFWDGKNDFGDYVGNGMYIYLITSSSKILHNGHMAVIN